MKLPEFDYASPASLNEAVGLLAKSDGSACIIAGGQSLLPMMAFRLANPTVLVDLRQVPGLDRIDVADGWLRLGALVTWRAALEDARLAATYPLLVAAIEHVAHYQIRNRGTIGGSLAHADPAAELPLIAITCDARIEVEGVKGRRTLEAADLFVGPLMTSLANDEIIIRLDLPQWKSARRWGFEEFARRRGDFAIAGVAVFYDLDATGHAINAHIGAIGAADVARRLHRAEAVLNGAFIDARVIADAADAAKNEVDPPGDFHASAAYRRSLIGTLLDRALTKASTRS